MRLVCKRYVLTSWTAFKIYVGRSTVTAAVYVEATLDGKISAVSVPVSVSCEILEGAVEKE